MEPFRYSGLPVDVTFGRGQVEQVARLAETLGAERLLVLSTPGQVRLAERISGLLGGRSVGVHAGAVMHVPVDSIEQAMVAVRDTGADGVVAAGGGSTIGLAKAVALQADLPILAIPTTYSGSEMTRIWGITEDGIKRTGKDPRVLPAAVLYDADLSHSLPAGIAATSGMNALAHCVEGLYAESANPVISLMAEEGVRALAASLPRIVAAPDDPEPREQALYGAWLAGMVLGSVGMALHHKLCHTLGGTFNLPHAEVHTVVIPYVTAYNSDAAPTAMAALGRALSVAPGEAAHALFELNQRLNAPASLAAIGFAEGDIERAADLATRNPYFNPRPVDHDSVRRLLEQAYRGDPPENP